jgi:hypothetical protein
MQDFSVSLAPSRLDQVINPWTWNLFTINLGQSSDPKLERRILDEVGTYGRQLGQIGDAVGVLMSLVDRSTLSHEQEAPLDKLDDQLKLVALIKAQRGLEKKLGYTTAPAAPASAN